MSAEHHNLLPPTPSHSSPLRITGCRSLNLKNPPHTGPPQFQAEGMDSQKPSCWLAETGASHFQKLSMEPGFLSPETHDESMEVETSEKMACQQERIEPQKRAQTGKAQELREGSKGRTGEIALSQYESLEEEAVGLIVDSYILKVKRAISSLERMKNKNIYRAIKRIESIYQGEGDFGLVVQYNSSASHRFISYLDMKENHPYELLAFLQGYLHIFYARLLFNDHIQNDSKAQAQLLGSIFDDRWRKDPSGEMRRERDGGEMWTKNIFSIEFQIEECLGEAFGDKSEHSRIC